MSTNTYGRTRGHLRLVENTGSSRATDLQNRRQMRARRECAHLADLEAEVRECREEIARLHQERIRLLVLCQRNGVVA